MLPLLPALLPVFLLLACSPSPVRLGEDAAPAAAPDEGDGGGGNAGPGDGSGGSGGDSAEPPDAPVEALPEAPATDPSDAVFDPWVIHTLDLEMDPAAWADIRDNPWPETWYEADLTFTSGGEGSGEGWVEGLPAVGVRAFGAGSKYAGKPPLKISFDHYVEGQDWRGLEQLKLDNSVQDFTFLHERITTEVLRDMGLPAARTGWVQVRVNGDPVGFFVLLEPIDDRFVKRWFGEDEGPLYGMVSGWYAQGLNPLPTGYEDPLLWYEQQTSVSADGAEILAAIEALSTGTDEEVAALIDLPEFTRISVARSVMGGIDTFSGDGNNFYLYSHNGVLEQIPWDLDADLGYPYAISNAMTVSLESPWLQSPWSWNPVTGAAYTDPVLLRHLSMGADVDSIVSEMFSGPYAWAATDTKILASAAVIRDAVYGDVLGYGPTFDQHVADLRLFVHQRGSVVLGRDAADCLEPEDGSVSLSDLSPTGTVGWDTLRVDATLWGPGFSVRGEHTCRGLFTHAPSVVQVTVPAGMSSLTGGVGLQDWMQVCGDGASFFVEQGGVTLWSSGSLGTYDPAVDMGSVSVEPGRLSLRVSPNAEYSCDTAAWLDLRLH